MPEKNHPTITIGGELLSEGEKMTLWVALHDFAMELRDADIRSGIGEDLANNYAARIADIQQKWQAAER